MKPVDADIFEYADFRKYLAEYQLNRYARDKRFSRLGICKMLGLPNTRSYFTDVLKGRVVSKNFVERFVQILELDKEQAQYFRVLVQFNQAENENERELFFDQLISLNRTPKRFIDEDAYAYYREWHHGAVRAMLDVLDIRDDFGSLEGRFTPALTPGKIAASVKLLKRLGLIAKDAEGYWKQTDKSITAGPYVQSEVIKQYQMHCFELGKLAVLAKDLGARNLSTMTMSVSGKMRDRLFQKIQKFKSEVRSMIHKDQDKAEHVYQLNLQLFPQSTAGTSEANP